MKLVVTKVERGVNWLKRFKVDSNLAFLSFVSRGPSIVLLLLLLLKLLLPAELETPRQPSSCPSLAFNQRCCCWESENFFSEKNKYAKDTRPKRRCIVVGTPSVGGHHHHHTPSNAQTNELSKQLSKGNNIQLPVTR